MFGFFKKREHATLQSETIEKEALSDTENIDRLMQVFKEQTGIEFEQKKSIFQNKVTSFARNHEIRSFAQCIDILQGRGELTDKLIDVLTTNETYFYREVAQIHEMARLIKQKNQKVRILSAPCSTGEEPYTIAMILIQEGINIESVEIVAIDINPFAVEFAKKGCYREKSLRNLTHEVRSQFFYHSDTHECVKHYIRDRISFRSVNIFDAEFKNLGKFDYIFSRNMLIYFDYDTKIKVKELLEGMLKDKETGIYFGHADLF
jgi:chemotaxis protein methyltransferase CheR